MKSKFALATLASMLLASTLCAQTAKAPKAPREPGFVDPVALDLEHIIPAPPAQGSNEIKAEFAALHKIESERTQAQVAAAQADDGEETMFVFRTVLGPAFKAESLPLTAALSAKLHKEESSDDDKLKAVYQRPRPYQADKTLHPVCKTTTAPNSYPSGHTLTGYLEALALVEIVPEKRNEILARADDYAHNRLVCGVHYPSDLAASHLLAYAIFGNMMTNPDFKAQLAAAKAETRKLLGLN